MKIILAVVLFYLPLNFVLASDSTCDDYQCQQRGFDCCEANSCVIIGTEKPEAQFEENYEQARQDVQNDYTNIFRYPNIYYTCQQ